MAIYNIHNRKPVKPAPRYAEWQIQAYVVAELFRLGILCHGDQNAGKRGPRAAAQAKATGMCAGWPDLQIVLPHRVVFVEFKLVGGVVSKAQREVHQRLDELGFYVNVVYADTPEDAWERVKLLLA